MLAQLVIFALLNFVLVHSQQYICANTSEKLNCSDGLVINITEAYYGRENFTICSTNSTQNTSTLNCSYRNVSRSLSRNCNGLTTCTVTVRDGKWDRCLLIPKYLVVNYECVNASSIQAASKCGPNQHYSTFVCDCLNRCQTPDFDCLPFCNPEGGCICNIGFQLDPITLTCVGDAYCPQASNLNATHEEFTNCASRQRYCKDHPIPMQDICIPGYQCASGYSRDCFTSMCVREDECTRNHPRGKK